MRKRHIDRRSTVDVVDHSFRKRKSALVSSMLSQPASDPIFDYFSQKDAQSQTWAYCFQQHQVAYTLFSRFEDARVKYPVFVRLIFVKSKHVRNK